MSLAAAVLRLSKKAASSGATRAICRPSSVVSMVHPRTYSLGVGGAAAHAGITAAGSGAAFRVMGYNVPWSAILGVALVSGMGAYAYETKKVADVDRQPLENEVMRFPSLPEGALLMSQTGKKIDVAQAVRGNYALLAFGALHSTDQPLLETMAKCTQTAKKRTGMDIIPVYISLDAAHDKPEDLKIAAGRSGSSSMLVVTGPPNGLLEAAERFKNVGIVRQQAVFKGTELQKKVGSMTSNYTSDYYYLVDQNSRIVSMMPKKLRAEEVVENLTEEIQRSAVNMVP